MSHSYSLTFEVGAGLTHCRLPEDWTGSDHGTVLFLRPPRECGGTGYASSARGFEPAWVPRIEVYYGRTNELPRAPCRGVVVGRVRFLGRARVVCASSWWGMAVREVRGLYVADGETEAAFTLVTMRSRLRRDLPVFRRVLRTVRACSIPWEDAEGRARVMGSGRACAAEGDFY